MTTYEIVATGLWIGFGGGFGYFFYLWWKASGFQKFVENARDVNKDVNDVIDRWQGQK